MNEAKQANSANQAKDGHNETAREPDADQQATATPASTSSQMNASTVDASEPENNVATIQPHNGTIGVTGR